MPYHTVLIISFRQLQWIAKNIFIDKQIITANGQDYCSCSNEMNSFRLLLYAYNFQCSTEISYKQRWLKETTWSFQWIVLITKSKLLWNEIYWILITRISAIYIWWSRIIVKRLVKININPQLLSTAKNENLQCISFWNITTTELTGEIITWLLLSNSNETKSLAHPPKSPQFQFSFESIVFKKGQTDSHQEFSLLSLLHM